MRHDLKRDLGDVYKPPLGRFVEVDVPKMQYLSIDGHGDPHKESSCRRAIESLYVCAYQIRAGFKRRTGSDFVVGPIEGLWPSDESAAHSEGRKGHRDWTMLIPLPEEVDAQDVADGLSPAARKKPDLPIALVRPVTITEGRCLQTLNIGSIDDEARVLARLHHEIMPRLGLTRIGRHHEVYLGDPRRTCPDKRRTILRQPVSAA
ncbi:GyrI-like domain-containing protein [Microbacter sp. GSS18]|nr:GyrI-like domain-containing protein [Microbacter sp. GSS18]